MAWKKSEDCHAFPHSLRWYIRITQGGCANSYMFIPRDPCLPIGMSPLLELLGDQPESSSSPGIRSLTRVKAFYISMIEERLRIVGDILTFIGRHSSVIGSSSDKSLQSPKPFTISSSLYINLAMETGRNSRRNAKSLTRLSNFFYNMRPNS